MDEQFGLHIFSDLIHRHMVSAFFLLLTIMTILSLLGIRWWLRRRLQRMLEEKFEEESELDALPSPGPNDQEALELIRQFRQEVWTIPEGELQLSVEAFNQRAVRVVQAISGVYHEEAEAPQYEASLVEILHLIRRVSTRLTRLASAVPFKYLGDRKLSDYQRYYQVYRTINDNPFVQIFKRNPHLQRIAKWAVNLKNIANPLYWAGKELSREGYFYMLRWFYLTFVSQVGREAMRLYSGRHFQTEEDRDAALICYRLFALARKWGGPCDAEWSALVDFITGHSALEAEIKLHVLSRCSQGRLPKDLDSQILQTKAGARWYREGLKRLRAAEAPQFDAKKRLLEQELSSLENRNETGQGMGD